MTGFFWKRLSATKSLEMLHKEMEGENRLRRVLGPVGLTSLGIGAIIGAGIFVMTGRVAAQDAGPAIILSYIVAGFACALAAFCYAEFASMAPVAGSAYTYAYATLGELFAWIIGWDLILEYAMSAATVAASWTKYLNEFLKLFGLAVPDYLSNDPWSHAGAWMNLPAVLILGAVTYVLVIGIRESAASNTALVVLKLSVVIFVIVVGVGYINPAYWTTIPPEDRKLAEEQLVPKKAEELSKFESELLSAAREIGDFMPGGSAKQVAVQFADGRQEKFTVPPKADLEERAKLLRNQAMAAYRLQRIQVVNAELLQQGRINQEQATERLRRVEEEFGKNAPTSEEDKARAQAVIARAKKMAPDFEAEKWGMIGEVGLNKSLVAVDDAVRSSFMPFGFSGMMLGAALVFFAFIGFDSISTHSEEAIRPQRDVPIGIMASLFVCTFLYVAVAAIITAMKPYPEIDPSAAVASAFRERAEASGGSPLLRISAGLIAAGALAGMTSVLLITFLSQARIFLAMARDRLMPPAVFGAVHEKFRTPHISTMLTGAVMCVVAAFTPITTLEEMVNIGTLFAFVVVCAAVLILRIRRPDAHRPFRCPAVFVVAPLGILVNLTLMLFLPLLTWMRLFVWLLIGLVIYFGYGYFHSALGKQIESTGAPLSPEGITNNLEGISPPASETSYRASPPQ
jgi:amino acid transporter